jgi:glutamyl-tRNA synthetase
MIRVRFAPSPTGFLHIGSARTALFNWLFARHNRGEFILRIEDTDLERSKKEFLEEILDSLKWLGLDWDGEILFQSKRLDIYRKKAKELLDKGLAYEAQGEIRDKDGNVIKDSKRITQKAIIFKVPQGKMITINDLVHGPIQVDSGTIKDQVMIKSDGFPTYNFACVIDDADMDITHVIRGDDHISNTPKQILFYEAFGFKQPQFGHVPLILGKDRSRMSKRHGATSIREYRDQGYLPQALVNFISLLGWAPGGDREILSSKDIIKEFDIKNVKSVNAVFDIEKLNWMNGQYINKLSDQEFLDLLAPGLAERGWKCDLKTARLFKERARTLSDFFEWSEYVFSDQIKYEDAAVDKRLKKPGVDKLLDETKVAFSALKDFNKETTEEALRKIAERLGMKAADIIHPVRVAVSGRSMGPGLFELLELLGRDKVIKRLEAAKKLV